MRHVEDRSGGLEIRNIGAFDVADASGELTIEHVRGSLTITERTIRPGSC